MVRHPLLAGKVVGKQSTEKEPHMADTPLRVPGADPQTLARIRATDSVDALEEPLNALAAIEELLQEQQRTYLVDVNSTHLTALLALVNRELYTRLDTAKTRLQEALAAVPYP